MANPVRGFWHRLTGHDRVEESIESLRITGEQMDAQKLARVKVLERNARDAAANFRAAELFDAALLEKEKADTRSPRRRSS